ncbi:MAG: arginine repressor [Clostridia bacterium]|nr:arginine repressor [Clostridia bacterium]
MKKRRHEKIKEIIVDHVVETQEDLLRYLKEAGYEVTQATVSRDMKELRLVKGLDSRENYRYMSPKSELPKMNMNFSHIFLGAVIHVDHAMNNVVIKCHSGMANAACAALDNMNLSSIVGTLAGDDTILVITRTEQQAQNLSKELAEMLHDR